jgi:Restriction endonuclease S subunits
MSRIEKLIEELCPEGVEFKKLIEVCKFSQGIQIDLDKQTTEYQDGKFRFIRIIDFTQGNQEPRYIDINDKRYLVENDDISMVRYGEAGFVCTGLKGIIANNLFKISPIHESINKRFLYYILKSNIVQLPIKNSIKQGSLPAISFNIFNFITIPIPPLSIQQEIVTILDTFTELDAELQAELEARRKQYEYYRNDLLNFEGKDVEWISFEDCFEIRNGYTPSKSKPEFWENGTIPWFRMEDIRANGKILSKSIQQINKKAIKGGKLFPANSIIIATSATIGEHALITTEYLSNQRFTCFYPNVEYIDKINMKFMYYYSYILSDWCNNNTNVSGFASVDMTRFKKLLIPIPPLSEQERIVEILDKFDALVSVGLPAEIAARRKQYEYYREKLLTFEPLTTNH